MKKKYSLISTGKKLLVAVFFVFTFIITNNILAQTTTIQLGSGTSSSGSNVACPINIYYQSLRCQIVYTKDEINAAGFNSQGEIQQLGFYVTGVPSQALPNFTIKMKHTTASNVASHDAGTLTTVFTASAYMPTAGGYSMIPFTTPFVWNGNDNVLVDVCFDPVSTWLSATGQVRIYSPSVTNGFRFKRDNFTSQCGQVTTSPSNFKPQVQMVIQDVCTPLSGVYSIGPTGDFLNFNYAINTLNNCGISAPVTFNVQSGTYNEQVTIPSISGSSSSNTITFQSLSGDSSDVILTYAPTTSTTNWTVRLNGADNIKFKNITIASSGTNYGRVVEFINHADNNEFSNNQILMPTTTSSSFAGFYSYTTSNNNNKIYNNRIVNGYYGLYLRGQNSTNYESGIEIKNNIFLNQYRYFIMMYYCDAPLIEGNKMTTNSSNTSFRGIYSYYCINNIRILKNIISKSTNGGYGLYFYRLNYYTHTQSGLVANNFIHTYSSGNTTYCTYLYNSKDINFSHNSLNLTGTATSSRCLYLYGSNSSNITLNNNIFVNKANGYTIYSSINTSNYTSDYNDFYTTGTNLAYQSGNRTTLSAWQTASSGDANSINVDPGYYTDDDLHIGSIPLNGVGTPLASVTDDIDGESRNATTPDIGADEFTPSPIDVGASSLESPLSTICLGSSETVTIRVMNYGTVAINLATNPLTVNCSVTGTNPTTFSPVTVNSGNIAIGGYIDVSVSSTYNMFATGTYTFNATTIMTGDGNTTNNNMTSTDIVNYGTYSLPINETMETFTPGNGYISNPGTLDNGWMRTHTTNFQWLVKNGGTPSSNTGPVVDHTLGTTLGIYCYTESSSSSTNNVAELISPCIDLSSMQHPKLSFWYHMYGTTTGSMHIDILSGGSWINDLYVISGQQQTYQTEAWRDATVDISSYIGGIIKVRFRAIRGSSYSGDMAIDDVSITEYPVVDLGNDTVICQGGSVVLDAGSGTGYTYQWTEISSTTIIGTSQTYTATTSGDYIVIVTNSYGGTDSDTINIMVGLSPIVDAGSNDNVCEGNSYTISGATASYYSSIIWSTSGSGVFSNNGTISPTYSPSAADISSGSITLTVVANAYPPCSAATDNMTLTILPAPTVSFSGLAAGYCISDPSVSLTGTPVGGTFTGPGISGNNFNPAIAGVGTHTITYSYTDANGCSNNDVQSVIVNGIPNVTFSGLQSSYCINDASSSLTGSPSGGTFTGTGISGNNFNPASAGTGTHSITYTYVDAFGCSNTDVQSTTVHSLPTVSFSGLGSSYCANDPAITLTGNPTAGTFSGNGISGNSFSPTIAGAGNHSITYSYTDGNGCSNSDVQSTTVNSLPNVSFTGLAAGYCITDPNVTLTGTPSSGTFSGPGMSGNIFNPSSAGVGTHSITFTYTDANGCSNSDIQSVVVNPIPTVSFSGLNSSYCENASAVTLSGSPAGGTFSGTGISGNTFNPATSGVGTHSITYTYSDIYGCTNSDVQSTTVHSLPSVSFSGLGSSYCEDASAVTLTGNPTGGTFSGSGISANTFNPASAGVGTHAITYSYTDINGCSNSDIQNTIVHPLPTVSFSGLAAGYCVTDTFVTLMGTPTGGTFSGPGMMGSSFFPSLAGAGTHTITYSYTDINGCTNNDIQSVIVNPIPTVSFSGLASSYCEDASVVSLTGTPSGGTFSGTGISGNSFNPATAGVGTHSITYTYSDIYGCTNSDVQSTTVHSLPSVSFSGLGSSYCSNASAVTLTGNPNGGTFSGTGISGNSFDPASAGVGTHSITYIYTDMNGCSNSDVQLTTVNSLPTVSFSGLAAGYCVTDSSATLLGTPSGGTFSGNGMIGNIFDPATAGVGTHSITYSYTDINGCSNTDIQTVIVSPIPTVSFTGLASSYCVNAPPVTLTGVPSGGTFTGPGMSGNIFTPANAGGSIAPITIGTGTTTNTGIQYPTPYGNWYYGNKNQFLILASELTAMGISSGNIQSLAFNVANVNACPSLDNFEVKLKNTTTSNLTTTWESGLTSVYINSSHQPVNGWNTYVFTTPFIWDGSSNLLIETCFNNTSYESNGNASVYQSSTTFSSTHEFHQDNSSVCTNPGTGTTYNQRPNIKLEATVGTGVYNITYSYTSPQGCSNEDIQTVTIHSLPSVSFTGLAPSYCENASSVTLTGTPSGGTFSGSGISGNSFNPASAGVGNHSITYSYTDINGCTNSSSQSVDVIALPTVSFSGLASSYCLNSSSNFLTGSPFGGTFSGPGITGNSFNPNTAGVGTHTITYTFSDWVTGCTNTAIQNVTVHSLPSVSISGFNTPPEYCANSSSFTVTGSPAGGTLSGNGISGNTFDPSVAGIGIHLITYAYTDANSCTNTDSIEVTIHSLPGVTLSPFADVCVDASSFALSGGLPWGGTYSGTGVSSGNFDPATAGAGVHTITYTYSDINGCTNSATQTATVHPLPTVSITGLSSSYCIDAPAVTLTGNPNGGTFSGTGVTGNTFDPATAGLGTHTITYTYTDGNSCTNSDIQSVVINPLPTVSFSGLAANYCIDSIDVVLTGNPSGGTFSGNGVMGNIFNPIFAGLGIHQITYTYTDPNGCTNSDVQTVTVNPGPTVSFSGLASAYCENDMAVTLTGNPSGGTFSGPGISANSFDPVVAGVGTHIITYMYTDLTGCTGSTNQSVIVNSLPTLSISGLNPGYCINSPMVSLIGSPSGGTFSGNGITGNTFDPAMAGVGTHIVTYTYTDGNSCTNSINQNVTINNLPTVSFTGLNTSYCINDSSSILIGLPSGGTFSGTGISGNIFSPTLAGVGTHNITYTYSDAFGCSNSTTQSTTVNDLPTVSFTGLASNYCSDTTGISLFGSPGGGTFSGNGIIGNTFNPDIAGAGFHTITYTFTDINGCSNSTSQQTLVNAAPIANAGNDTTVNYGATFQLNGSASGGSGNYTYFWTGTMAISNPNIAKPTVSGITTSSIFLLFVFDNTTGCYDTSSVQVNVSGGPLTVNITTMTPTICEGSSADLISLVSGGLGTYTYLWSSIPPGFNSTIADPTVSPIVTTTYTLTVSDGSPSGVVSDSITITVDPLPIITISGLQASYCLNSSPVTMTGSPAGGSFSGSGVSGNVFDPSIAGLGTHDIIYTYTSPGSIGNPFGCTNSDTQTVVVNTLPNVSFSGLATSYCADVTSVTLTGSPAGGTFSGPGISGNIFNPSIAGPGTHNITYDYSAGSGCSNSETQSVIVYALPNVTISGLLPNYCANSPIVTMTGIPSGGTFSGSGVIGNTFDPSLAGTGTHTITYTYTDGNSCSTAAGQTVTVNPLPPVSFSGLATSYCLSSNSSTLTGTPVGGTFSGSGITGNIFDPALAGVGTHSITYLYTDAFGCSNSDIQTVNVDTLPTVTIVGLASVYCLNSGLVTLTGSPTGGTFSGPGVSANTFNPSIAGVGNHSITYNYNDGNGCSNSTSQTVTVNPLPNVSIIGLASNYCLNDPSVTISGSPAGGSFSGTGIIANTFNPSIAGTGIHQITYSYTDANGCSNNAIQNVSVDTLPNVSFTGLSPTYCEDSINVTLIGIPSGGVFSGNGVIGNVFNPQFAGSGTHSITYTYTGANGCTNTYSQNTTVNSNPIANAGVDIVIFSGQTTTLSGSATGSNLKYSWSPASLLNNANIANPTTVALYASNIFTLTVTDSVSGCQGTDEVQVTIGGGPLSVVATANPMTICAYHPTQLTAIGTGGTATYTYNWSSNPPGFSSTLANPNAAPVATTTYTVTISDAINTSTASVVVTVNPTPNVSFSGLSTSYCLNSPAVTLTGTPSGGTYSGPGISGNIFDPIIAGVGMHNITYSYTNTFGCTSSDTKTVIINPLPVVSFSGLQAVYCSTSIPDTLTGNPFGGTFSGPGITGDIFDPFIAGSGTHSISYSYTDANGCVNSDIQSTIVMLTTSVNFTGLNPVYCENDPPSTLTGFPTGGTFSGPGISGNIFDPMIAGSGTHNITYDYTDANGCSGSETQSIVVNQLPLVSISGLSTMYCLNAPIDTIIGTPTGGIFSGPGIKGNTFDAQLAGIGNHNILYSYTDANGCSNTANQNISVNNIPIANAGPDTSFLCGLSGQIGVAGSSGFTYSWTPTTGLSNPLISNPIASPNLTTVYTLEVTDITTGCSSSDDMIVFVTGGPTAKVTPKDTMICGGNSVVLTASGGTSYSWSTSDITSSITVNPYKTTAYIVTVTTGACAASDTAIITVSHPNVDLGPDVSFCANSSITLDPGSGFSSYLWSDGSMSQSISVNTSGQYWVSVTDIMGCTNSDTINIDVNPIPKINLGNDTTINVKYSISLDAGMGFDDYLWSDSSTYQTLTVNGPSLGTGLFTYWVEVTDKNICSNRDTIIITIRDNTGIEDNKTNTSIKVYPNPTKGIIYLQVDNLIKNDIFVEILNPDGQTLYRRQLENSLNSIKEINMTSFSKGVYFVKVISKEQIFIKKVVLN